MEKLSREHKKARKALASEVDAAFKAAARARKWGYLKPTAFLRFDDWFVSFDLTVSTEARRSEIQVKIKPFALDDLVSRIMLHDGLDGTPLSLRARGPHCLVVPYFSQSIENDREDAEAMVEAAVGFAEASLKRIETLTLNDFIEFSRNPSGNVSVNQVAALILAGRNDEALQLSEAAILAKQWGGPARITEGGQMVGFFELARRWLMRN